MINAVVKHLIYMAVLMVLPTVSFGQIRYAAPIDSSANQLWTNTDSKLTCKLIHDSPRYGHAEFKTYGGHELKSSLQIVPRLGINDNSVMRFIATKPEWQSGGREVLLGKIKIYTGFNPYTGATLAWKILSALSHGQQIFMPYTDDKIASGQNIIPSLSPMGFDKAYQRYITCQENLLRVNYSDIQMLPLVFNYQENELTTKSKQRIQSQIDYIKEDKSVNQVTIRAYSYDMNNKNDNVKMALMRAEKIKEMFIEAGVKDNMIKVIPFNALTLPKDRENPPANYSVTARNALVSLDRDNSLVDRDLDVVVPDVGADSGEE